LPFHSGRTLRAASAPKVEGEAETLCSLFVLGSSNLAVKENRSWSQEEKMTFWQNNFANFVMQLTKDKFLISV